MSNNTWNHNKLKSGMVNLACLTEELQAQFGASQIPSVSIDAQSLPHPNVVVQVSGLEYSETLANQIDQIIDDHDGELCNIKIYVAKTCADRALRLTNTGLVVNYDVMNSQTPPKTTKIILNGAPVDMTQTHRDEILLYTAEVQNFVQGLTDSDYSAHSLAQWQDALSTNSAPWPVAPQTVIDLGIF